ncbi:UNVERIFIED_CONTAM: hypothetical protein Scaly_3078400, partial [Sesamum calycinum]
SLAWEGTNSHNCGLIISSIKTNSTKEISNHDQVTLDLGRLPQACYLGDSGKRDLRKKEVSIEELEYAQNALGEFGGDNRTGIAGTLHRISAIRNKNGRVVELPSTLTWKTPKPLRRRAVERKEKRRRRNPLQKAPNRDPNRGRTVYTIPSPRSSIIFITIMAILLKNAGTSKMNSNGLFKMDSYKKCMLGEGSRSSFQHLEAWEKFKETPFSHEDVILKPYINDKKEVPRRPTKRSLPTSEERELDKKKNPRKGRGYPPRFSQRKNY